VTVEGLHEVPKVSGVIEWKVGQFQATNAEFQRFNKTCRGGGGFGGSNMPSVVGLSSVLRPHQHSYTVIYMGDSFYKAKDPTNSIKVLKEQIVHRQIKHTINRHEHKTQQIP